VSSTDWLSLAATTLLPWSPTAATSPTRSSRPGKCKADRDVAYVGRKSGCKAATSKSVDVPPDPFAEEEV